MKLRPFTLLLFFLLVVQGTLSFAQQSLLDRKISIEVQKTSIKEVLITLEKQLGFTTTYPSNITDFKRVISINFRDETLHNILKIIFASDECQFSALENKLLIYKKPRSYTISGYVQEIESQEHLSIASVYIQELALGTTTNDYGFYSLTVPEGSYQLKFSHLGYKNGFKNLNLIADTTINLDLAPSVESLEEVIVTSNKVAYESEIIQMSSISLEPEKIIDIPALLGEKDIFKTLQLLPGIQTGTDGSSWLYVRGGTPDQNLIILDGATVYNANHLYGFFSIFNGDAIKSIEAFKGGFPARFGGRLSSVIKINMKDGNKERLSGKFDIGLLSSSILLEGPLNKGKTSFLLSARRTYSELFLKPIQSKKEKKSSYFFHDLNFKIHHVINNKNKLFWSNYHGQDQFKTRLKRKNISTLERLGWSNITSTLRWNHQHSNKIFSNTSLIYSNYNLNINYEENVQDTFYKYITSSSINDISMKTDFNYYPSPAHTISFGGSATYHKFVPQSTTVLRSSDVMQKNKNIQNSLENAIYVEDDWQVSERFAISSGLRISYFNHKSLNYLRPEPRIAFAWNVMPSLAVKTSYAKMNQYVHLLSNSGTGLPTDLWVSSSDRIPPQVSEQLAFGLAKDYRVSGYSLSLEGYYKKMRSVIAYKEGNRSIDIRNLETLGNEDGQNNVTFGKGWAYGTEILFKKQKGNLTGWLGYTLSWSQRQFKELNLGNKFNAKYDRRHDISLVALFKPSPKITVSGNWIYSSGANYTIPSVISLNTNNNVPFQTTNNIPDFNTTERAVTTNNFKGEATHRLDLGIQFHKKNKKNILRTWSFSLYNAYAQKNPFYYYIGDSPSFSLLNESPAETEVRTKTLRRVSTLVLIPSINYTLRF